MLLKWKAQIGMRGGVVAGIGGVFVWHRNPKHDRVSGGDFHLPDFIRNLRDDPGVAEPAGSTGRSMPELPELNPVIHGKLRLAVLSLLMGVDEAEFTWLRGKTGSTDGNLGAQLMKLEEAGYVAVRKVCAAQAANALPHDRGRAHGVGRVRAGAEAVAGRGNLRGGIRAKRFGK